MPAKATASPSADNSLGYPIAYAMRAMETAVRAKPQSVKYAVSARRPKGGRPTSNMPPRKGIDTIFRPTGCPFETIWPILFQGIPGADLLETCERAESAVKDINSALKDPASPVCSGRCWLSNPPHCPSDSQGRTRYNLEQNSRSSLSFSRSPGGPVIKVQDTQYQQ